ncbi:hypothetical protein [Paracoccus marinaquae]|uniref:Uncharacterized protein n=1 Tax=Paracoccus marinaquae TaxID=2841926 RepID=A0ABS6ALX4_9RHOB|nr:hypothetical protein [Paracoccus marinaquae]MBU3031489.1 hypothetical protein [Paracoccus marinaquae]
MGRIRYTEFLTLPASVILPPGVTPPWHWPKWEFPPSPFDGTPTFDDEWLRWRADPDAYTPPPKPD